MYGVLGRKSGSGASAASALTKSLYASRRLAESTGKICTSTAEEMVCHARGIHLAHNFSLLAGGSTNLRSTRECLASHESRAGLQIWKRYLCFSSGNLVDAVVPFMGESASDGTLATLLKKPGDQVEKEINSLAKKANSGNLSTDKMTGGTFTISNGDVYGRILPQSAILGMHTIVSRPMVGGSNIFPRPTMYTALRYDHTMIDGRENQETINRSHNRQNILRPLSPHLPIYKPQQNSTLSIFNRISGAFLSTVVLSFYLLCLKIGPICFTYENFYQILFYSSKLLPITIEITAVALSYHLYAGVRHLLADFSGKILK